MINNKKVLTGLMKDFKVAIEGREAAEDVQAILDKCYAGLIEAGVIPSDLITFDGAFEVLMEYSDILFMDEALVALFILGLQTTAIKDIEENDPETDAFGAFSRDYLDEMVEDGEATVEYKVHATTINLTEGTKVSTDLEGSADSEEEILMDIMTVGQTMVELADLADLDVSMYANITKDKDLKEKLFEYGASGETVYEQVGEDSNAKHFLFLEKRDTKEITYGIIFEIEKVYTVK